MDALNLTRTVVDDADTLVDLWRRRTSLTRCEMERIYLLVRDALHGYHPIELRSLPEDKEELISQFIFSRVLRLDTDGAASHASPESAPSTVFALCAYFRRFLIDCLRSASYQRNVSIELNGVEELIDARARPLDDPITAALSEHGLDEAKVRLTARALVASLDEPDRVILAGSLGCYLHREGGLRGIAQLHGIPSYHYRARKLGVTLKKSATPADFAETKIGRWIEKTLGIAIDEDSRDVILIVLSLLAFEANA